MQLKALYMLTGNWICKSEKFETEELWQKPKAGLMLGLNRTVSKEGKTTFEFLRIFQTENEIIYAASPAGKTATYFKLTELSENRAVFENAEHDFPQKIIYHSKNHNELHARIEGELEGKISSREWLFFKV